MDFPAGSCPWHDVPLLARRNVKDEGTFDPACLICDAAARGCSKQVIAAQKHGLAKWEKEKG